MKDLPSLTITQKLWVIKLSKVGVSKAKIGGNCVARLSIYSWFRLRRWSHGLWDRAPLGAPRLVGSLLEGSFPLPLSLVHTHTYSLKEILKKKKSHQTASQCYTEILCKRVSQYSKLHNCLKKLRQLPQPLVTTTLVSEKPSTSRQDHPSKKTMIRCKLAFYSNK